MAVTTVGVIRERYPGENRVAITPDVVTRISTDDVTVIVESGAGTGSRFSDEDYRTAGARIGSLKEVIDNASVICCVNPAEPDGLRTGQILIGVFEPLHRTDLIKRLQAIEATVVSLDLLPRKLSRAQSMDVLSSQANIAGYKAALVAADAYGRYFPMLTTAAGTSQPATVLILGTGVAGLSAIGTARRLGAVVTAYDVRPEAKGEVESLGARFLELTSVASGSGEGGYARQLTETEREAQQAELAEAIGRFDVVITTAKVPGRKPPILVTEDAVARMRPGAVVVDMAAGELGGNVAQVKSEGSFETDNGVTIIGAGNLPSQMAPAASTAYARNISAVLKHLIVDGTVHVDTDEEITGQIVVTHQGRPVSPALADALTESTDQAGDSA
ncbi:NAD(P) transhydrogenase subunit alpha [Stackebrandtia endophytica]|uniref:proton-translocating NAD(P)(+) transhydrogenase n=1 Tax=Stackebrandtia endophytica TaxID=1496996 RepID=A0A543AS07_9ACTN|nr:NAD(P) transhydrogenase subunit alpha [Stackebrandtia endophytica]TQL75295.1 NAD(P) transhydrogenase subunit alpha [Stackebrandtia endophytica]